MRKAAGIQILTVIVFYDLQQTRRIGKRFSVAA